MAVHANTMPTGLLGEADIVAGQVICPRSPPDAHAFLTEVDHTEYWIVEGICAYVPQVSRPMLAVLNY